MRRKKCPMLSFISRLSLNYYSLNYYDHVTLLPSLVVSEVNISTAGKVTSKFSRWLWNSSQKNNSAEWARFCTYSFIVCVSLLNYCCESKWAENCLLWKISIIYFQTVYWVNLYLFQSFYLSLLIFSVMYYFLTQKLLLLLAQKMFQVMSVSWVAMHSQELFSLMRSTWLIQHKMIK